MPADKISTRFSVARRELVTVRDWLRYAVSVFNRAELTFGHGSATAFDEATYLILHTLHLPLDLLEPFLDARLLRNEIDSLASILETRVDKGVPAAYLTHEAWLASIASTWTSG